MREDMSNSKFITRAKITVQNISCAQKIKKINSIHNLI